MTKYQMSTKGMSERKRQLLIDHINMLEGRPDWRKKILELGFNEVKEPKPITRRCLSWFRWRKKEANPYQDTITIE